MTITELHSEQDLRDRAVLVGALSEALIRTRVRWAWRGDSVAVARWVGSCGRASLDLWIEALPDSVAELLDACGARVVDAETDPRRRHVTWAVTMPGRTAALVDVTIGDLRVGAMLLCPSSEITTDRRRLTSAAALVDLVVLPLLHGKVVEGRRWAEAVSAWQRAPEDQRAALMRRLANLDRRLPGIISRVLDRRATAADVTTARRARLRHRLAPTARPGSVRLTAAPSCRS